MAGVPLQAVQRILRHSDPRLTSETYGHLAADWLSEHHNRLRFNVAHLVPEALTKPEVQLATVGASRALATIPPLHD